MFKSLNQATTKPEIWSEYTAEILWADSHIAKQMLSFHLNPDIGLASRSFAFIDSSVDWLIDKAKLNKNSKIIDFGCGPGLYTQRFKAKQIGTVVGLDFSANSLEFAKTQAKQKNLNIEYHLGNYLDYQDDRKFDLIILIMCDLCALSPLQRSMLFAKFKTLLAENGVIALDVYTETRFAKQIQEVSLEKNAMHGFWSEQDYWCIKSTFNYQEELVTLDKYAIYQSNKDWAVYNWLEHFTYEKLNKELLQHGLVIGQAYSNLCGDALVEDDEMAVIIKHQ